MLVLIAYAKSESSEFRPLVPACGCINRVSHRFEKCLDIEDFLEKYLKTILQILQMKQRFPFWELTYGHWV